MHPPHVFEPATQMPDALQVSLLVHFSPSSQLAPVFAVRSGQFPVAGSQVLAFKHWVAGGQVLVVPPVQTPLELHFSPVVHILPSSQVSPVLAVWTLHVPPTQVLAFRH